MIQQLREVAEKEPAWLEKNRLLYTRKREQLESLIKGRGITSGEVTPKKSSFSVLLFMKLDDSFQVKTGNGTFNDSFA